MNRAVSYWRSRRRSAAWALWVVACAPLAASAQGTRPASSGPAPLAPARARAPGVLAGPAAATLPVLARTRKVLPIAPAASVAEALEFTEQERIVLADVRDGDGQFNYSPLYVLLRRAAMVPGGEQAYRHADRPNPENFWLHPQRYRGALVEVELVYRRLTDWSDRVVWTRWWGERGLYWMDVLERSTGRPMIVLLPRRPAGRFSEGQPLRCVGLFYKLLSWPVEAAEGQTPRRMDFPVLVAVTVEPPPRRGRVPTRTTVMLLVVVALLVLYMVLRRRVTRRSALARTRYRPLRTEGGGQADGVDEELVRQVEAFRSERAPRSEESDVDTPDNSR